MRFRVGDWVEIKSKVEILAALDERGCLDDLPFMPQMLEQCGKRFQIRRQAHKLCDTVTGTGARGLKRAVFLLDRPCDGRAYGGCEMECPIVWKEAWLKPANGPHRDDGAEPVAGSPVADQLDVIVKRNTQPPDRQTAGAPTVYSCQATEMPRATTRLSVWDPRQYVEDFRSRNAGLSRIAGVLLLLAYDTLATAGVGLGAPLRWLFDTVQKIRGGPPYPCRPGKLARNSRTPSVRLHLQPGDVIKVKKHQEILETVTEDLVNRGMSFHPDMVRYCEQSFRVSKRLSRLINERTGHLLELRNECVVLENAPCNGRFTKPLLCPRGMSPYWRGIWLEKVDAGGAS